MKHDWLKGKCKGGKVSVFNVRTTDAATASRNAGGRNMVMTQRKFSAQLVARDQQAWPIIQRDAAHIEAVLECRKCHEQHVLVRQHTSGQEALTALRLGRTGVDHVHVPRMQVEGFSNDVRFDVTHDGGWFEFKAPMMFDTQGTARLQCQKCGDRDTPKVRLT